MIEFEGRDYIVDDPTTNAYNLLNYVNNYMASEGIKNRKGEVVKFNINLSSPIWLIVFGIGYMLTVVQKMLFAVANAFSINSCSDQQVLNLAQIARVDRKLGSYTTMVMRVTAGDEDCIITPSDVITVEYENKSYVFSPVTTYTIEAGTTDSVATTADTIGPVYITAGTIDKFDATITNMESCINLGSEPGTNIETIASLRTRIQQNETATPIDATVAALNGLTGVTRANVFYNVSNTDTVMVAGIGVPPRSSILFVQGASDKIAKTYFSHMLAPTVIEGEHVITQVYTADNGQDFTIGYYPPSPKDIYIKVAVTKVLPEEEQAEIKNTLAKLSNSLAMGVDYTQAYMLNQLTDSPLYNYIVGLTLSVDGETYSNIAIMDSNNIGIISSDNISVELN